MKQSVTVYDIAPGEITVILLNKKVNPQGCA